MIVRQYATALRRGVKRNARLLDKLLQLRPGLRPDDAAAGEDDGIFCFSQRRHELVDLRILTLRTRTQQRATTQIPLHFFFGAFAVEDVRRHIQIHRAGLAAHGFLKRVVHHLRDAADFDDLPRPLAAAAHDGDLIDLLKRLPPNLVDGTGAADGHHRRAVDQRISHAGGEIDYTGAAGGHAHCRFLQQTAVRLRRQCSGLLVAHVDHAYALLGARGFGMLHGPAHDVEDILGAFVLERAAEDFVAGDVCHDVFSLFLVCASYALRQITTIAARQLYRSSARIFVLRPCPANPGARRPCLRPATAPA